LRIVSAGLTVQEASDRAMDKGILYIIAGILAVLIIAVGVEVGIDSATTTGIDLRLSSRFVE
jgi:hypothetical protein